jgi:hypothetical protein
MTNGNRRSRDPPSAAEPYVVESGIPGRVQGCGLEMEPAGACWPYDPPALFTGTGALYGTPTSAS